MQETVRGLRPSAHLATAADMRDIIGGDFRGVALLPRRGGWRVCVIESYSRIFPGVPDWLTPGEFFAITEIAVAAWNALLDPDPFRASVTECPPDMWENAGRPKEGLVIVGFDDSERADGGWVRRQVRVGRGQAAWCVPPKRLAAIIVHELGHGLGLAHGGHGVMRGGSCDPVPNDRESAVAQRFFHGAPARLEHYRAEQRRLIAAEAAAPAGPAFVPPLRDGESGQLTIWRARSETDEAAIAAALERDSCSRVTRTVLLEDGGVGAETDPSRSAWPEIMIVVEHRTLDVSQRRLADGRIFHELVLDGGRLVPGAFRYDGLWLMDCS